MAVPTDVVVVGAGPAGSIAALMLARAGVRVRLIDRARFPRNKLCGDTVNPGSLAVLDEIGLGQEVRNAAIPISGMTVTGPHGARVTAEYPQGLVGAALSRRVLDQALVAAAVSAGAVFDDGVIVSTPRVDRARVTGVAVRCVGGDRPLSASVVIAADGRASRLGGALGLTSFAARPRRWAFGAYYDGVTGLTSRGEMHVREDGYIGVAPLPDGLANVCAVKQWSRGAGPARLSDADLTSSPRLWRPVEASAEAGTRSAPRSEFTAIEDMIASDPALHDRFAHARRISDVTVLGPLAVEARGAGCPGLLLAGDAAGFVDPMTGDGLRFALRGGALAAEYALRELDRGSAQHRALDAARRREFSSKWRVNRALRALVASPRAVAVAAALSRRWQAPVRAIVAAAGDVSLALHQDRRA